MALISTSVPTLVNGVSQQAENLRFTSQCDEQLNGFSSVLRGLLKRPPTKHVAALGTAAPIGSFPTDFQTVCVNRSASEQYMLLLGNQTLRVFDLNGAEIPVKNAAGDPISPGDLAYLATATPKTSLRALTVADYTLLLNRERTAELLPAVTPTRFPAALVFIKQLRKGATYTLKLYGDPDAASPDYTFSLANVETDVSALAPIGPVVADQQAVANALNALLSASPANTLYEHDSSDAQLFLTKADGSDFRIEIECTIVEGAAVFKDTVQNFSMLPKKSYVGFPIKVIGDPEDGGDDYYLRYRAQAAGVDLGFAEGYWEESQALGLQDQIDPATMPHALLNFGSYFQFKPLTWASRQCGDTATNPTASFIGKKIRDLFFTKNRLGFVADENTILSESGKFFNFWRTTVIQVLDSDPIDVAVSHTKISILNYAVAASEELLFFSDQTQFKLTSDGLLTPKTASVPNVSDYENIATVAPKALGDSVVFAFQRGGSSGFYDYSVEDETGKLRGFDITEHVPSYLRGTVESFDVSSVANIVVAKTSAYADSLFVYQFFKRQRQRLQSAWHRWTFSGTVRGFFVLQTKLYVIVERASLLQLESMELDVAVTDADSDFTVLLDRKVNESQVSRSYDPVTERTTFGLPYAVTEGRAQVIQRTASGFQGGAEVPLLNQAFNTLTAAGDWTNVPLWFGERYRLEQTLTRPQLREQRGDGSFAVMPGRFQVKRGFLSYNDSMAFSVEVTPRGRPTYTYTFTPRNLGTLTTITGSPPAPQDGVFPFTVLSKNDQVTIKLVNDSPLPCALLSIDWEALYTLRSQRT